MQLQSQLIAVLHSPKFHARKVFSGCISIQKDCKCVLKWIIGKSDMWNIFKRAATVNIAVLFRSLTAGIRNSFIVRCSCKICWHNYDFWFLGSKNSHITRRIQWPAHSLFEISPSPGWNEECTIPLFHIFICLNIICFFVFRTIRVLSFSSKITKIQNKVNIILFAQFYLFL